MKIDIRAALIAATMLVLAACAAPAAPATPTAVPQATPAPTAGSMKMSAPFDATFIDGMIVHHQGAIDMANDALKNAQRPEIKALAADIIKAQQAEIAQMKQWRATWYPNLKDTGSMTMNMGPMAVQPGDAPYDIRFIDAMIPHHESALTMAGDAKQKAEHAEIKMLADAIITSQSAEIAQMKQWRAAWGK